MEPGKGSRQFPDDWHFYIVVKECTVEKPGQKTLRILRGSLGQACQERNSLGRTIPPSKGKRSLRILDQTNVVVSVDERDVMELEEKLAELAVPHYQLRRALQACCAIERVWTEPVTSTADQSSSAAEVWRWAPSRCGPL